MVKLSLTIRVLLTNVFTFVFGELLSIWENNIPLEVKRIINIIIV